MARRLLFLFALLPLSCGYQMVRPGIGHGRTISVPTTENRSQWLGLEAELTQDLRADLQRQLDLRLGPPSLANFTLKTTIEDVGRRSRVNLRSGGAAIGVSELAISWQLLDAKQVVLGGGLIRRNLEFLTSLDEDARQAFTEIFVEISQQIALEVGAQLQHQEAEVANP